MYLAELALRFQVTGCSEASCERTISAQRLIYTDRRLNSSQELLESRLQMIELAPNKIKKWIQNNSEINHSNHVELKIRNELNTNI